MRVEEALARLPHGAALRAARDDARVPAWVVGGSLRDLLLGREVADVDVATPHPEALARAFAARTGGRLVAMDPARGVWRVALAAEIFLDFCAFRDRDILGDLAGRDFTINAIALRLPDDEAEGGWLDPFHGIDDLRDGVLRIAGPHAFRDDPARVLRAFRFMAELRLAVEDATWSALQKQAPRLAEVAPERILAEWWKLCGAPHVSLALQRMDEARVLALLFPEVQATKGITQNRFHHLDVWEHSLLATAIVARNLQQPEETFQDLLPDFAPLLDDSRRRARLIFATLIHDVGKPATRSVRGDKVHFYEHERVGAEAAAAICRRLRMSNRDTRAVTAVVRHHLRPLFLYQGFGKGALSKRAMTRFFDDTGDCAPDVMALALADKAAARGPGADPDVVEGLRAMYRVLLAFYHGYYRPAVESPLLSGEELVAALDVPPGPAIARARKRLRELQAQGKLTSREEALRWARSAHSPPA